MSGFEAVWCYACEAVYESDRQRCTCGEPLWGETDAATFEWPVDGDDSMWRYREVLPYDSADGIAGSVGNTPLIRTETLDAFAGCTTYLKNEAENPTGSFKDRGSALAAVHARANDIPWIGTVSHGNMAMSMAAHAAGAGLECLTLVPDDISDDRITAIGQFGPTLCRVQGDYGELYYDALDLEDQFPIAFTNSDSPLRVAGQKTVAYEICEQFAGGEPDAIAVPVSSGGQASGIWKALRELETAGCIDTMPTLYWVQAAVCDPIARAYRNGESAVSRVEPASTIAYSIGNHDPPSGTRALAAARDTGGAALSVTEDEIRTATNAIAQEAGLCVEPACAVSLAGVRKLTARGDITRDDDIVCIMTGTGFKELGVLESTADLHTVEKDDLGELLEAVTG